MKILRWEKITPLGIKKFSKWKTIVVSTFLSELKQFPTFYFSCSQSKQSIALFLILLVLIGGRNMGKFPMMRCRLQFSQYEPRFPG